MVCRVCKGKTTVYNSLANDDSVVRERVCKSCGRKFVTVETESFEEDDAEALRLMINKQTRDNARRRNAERKQREITARDVKNEENGGESQ